MSTLAALALAANSASAGTVTIHSMTPKVAVHSATPEYNNTAINHVRKLPGRTSYDPIKLKRGVTQSQSFQQWEQGVSGQSSGPTNIGGAAVTKCPTC